MSDSALLDQVLKPGSLSVLFQPVVALHRDGGTLHSLECLVRGPRDTTLESPSVLFEYARRKRVAAKVDRAAVAASLRAIGSLPNKPRISVNVHATTLAEDAEFPDFLGKTAEAHGVPGTGLTVELLESAPNYDGPRLRTACDRLRALGVQVALDDVGARESSYRMAIDCHPEYFKTDHYLVRDAHTDGWRKAVLESIVHLANRLGVRVIAEGVTQFAELSLVVSLGIDLVQGYLISPPLPLEWLATGEILPPELVGRPPAPADSPGRAKRPTKGGPAGS
jgi:EAL domain-containing protein (putative c-di-GMP-specific phosphodiesterase class I)